MTSLAIIEDDLQIREPVHNYLSSTGDFEPISVFDRVEAFLSGVVTAPSVILLDITLAGMSGLEGAFHIKERFPTTEILMFTVHEDKERVFNALRAGATGYMLKNTPLKQIGEALLEAVSGGAPMSPVIAKMVINYFSNHQKRAHEQLTARENEVSRLLVEGLTYKQVAYHLHVSPDTIAQHIKHIYRKLQVNSRAELIREFNKG